MNDPTLSQRLDHRRLDEVHDCITPGCGQRAATAFAAAEEGPLGGRWWREGDMIDLCAPHANDVHNAQYKTRTQLPEWLKADAKPDQHELMLEAFHE